MSESGPLISVGLQFYNNEATLRRAIISILRQTHQNWELILHDDGSTDRGVEVARSFTDPRIRLFTDTTNRKRPYRLNQSIDSARGVFYAVMDGDDVAYPERLEKQLRLLESQPDVQLVGGGMLVFNGNGVPLGKRQPPARHDQICARPWSGFPVPQPTFMGRIEWFRKHRYCAGMDPAEDQDLLARSYRSSRFANIPEIVMGYRETRLRWRRLVQGRYYGMRGLFRQFRVEGRTGMAMMIVFLQLMKAGVDTAAVATGLKYRLLRHRAAPISDDEKHRWQQVYESTEG